MSEEDRRRAAEFAPLANKDAPLLYFDAAPNFGFGNGVVDITLEALRHTSTPDGSVARERVVVAYLRCSGAGFASLKQAIGGIDSMAEQGQRKIN